MSRCVLTPRVVTCVVVDRDSNLSTVEDVEVGKHTVRSTKYSISTHLILLRIYVTEKCLTIF